MPDRTAPRASGSSPVFGLPDVGRIEIPAGYVDADDYIERCCHILKKPAAMSAASAPTWTLCGLSLRRRPHALDDAGAFMCPSCERPRCPECVHRYQRGQR